MPKYSFADLFGGSSKEAKRVDKAKKAKRAKAEQRKKNRNDNPKK